MIQIIFNNNPWNKAAAFYLRTLVFVQEQGISPKSEFDALDIDSTFYLVIYHDSAPIATARYQQDDEHTLRPDRLCVHKGWRQQGIGRRVILELEQIGKKQHCTLSRIHGEKQAIGFYKKLGYQVVSDEFIEDGIICVLLEKKLQ
ncbi:GNAT family N-acetyltransferase [Vagococcus sp. JNUCC 83]